jgi:excisionase family DNA binding protein
MPRGKNPSDPGTDEIFTVSQVARLLHIGRNKVYDLTRQGQLPHFKLGPRDLRFRRSRLMAWMEEQENAA